MSLFCLTVVSCSAKAEVSSLPELTEKQSKNQQEKQLLPTNFVDEKENSHSQLENTSELLQDTANKQAKRFQNPARSNSVGAFNPATLGSYMTLIPTGRTNVLNNPLYELRLYTNGQLVDRFITVSGRAYTQTRNRHQSGTEAPLPDGRYKVATAATRGTIAEAGDRFLPIQPLFQTGRTFLGFHVDPSFEKNNGEDGTSGCIGLVSRGDLDRLLSFVRTYRPQFIDVQIQ
ncbi:MAG: L,D-transpeptidase [Goleter apudmare HA4340-LM2]|jgi:hypothetical protein|nr:L,D-transpeptidase [Goleter apudmare HA4340-LM2]